MRNVCIKQDVRCSEWTILIQVIIMLIFWWKGDACSRIHPREKLLLFLNLWFSAKLGGYVATIIRETLLLTLFQRPPFRDKSYISSSNILTFSPNFAISYFLLKYYGLL